VNYDVLADIFDANHKDPESVHVVLEELPDLGEPERKDFGAMVVDEDSFYIQFGIKHVDEIHETSPIYVTSEVLQKTAG
jgi:hypothetical protein